MELSVYQINNTTMGEPVNSNNLKSQNTYFSNTCFGQRNFKEVINVTVCCVCSLDVTDRLIQVYFQKQQPMFSLQTE